MQKPVYLVPRRAGRYVSDIQRAFDSIIPLLDPSANATRVSHCHKSTINSESHHILKCFRIMLLFSFGTRCIVITTVCQRGSEPTPASWG